MIPLIHRFILYLFGVILLLTGDFSSYNYLLSICLLIYICSLILINNPQQKNILKLLFIPVSFFIPSIALFTPSILYEQNRNLTFLDFCFLIPILLLGQHFSILIVIIVVIVSIISYSLGYQTLQSLSLQKEILINEDVSKELTLVMQKRNRELLERQEMEIHMARLNERNRISRDIHDNLGHLLTSSILQVGAMATTTKDNTLQTNLTALQKTLDEGLTSVRDSIHGMYADSFDLKFEIKKITETFDFCTITYQYLIENALPTKVKLAFLSIIKEALNNTMKHSDATHFDLILKENEKSYILILHDNGSSKQSSSSTGIGISSIEERVRLLNGIFNIQTEKGFRIYISIPKEASDETHYY